MDHAYLAELAMRLAFDDPSVRVEIVGARATFTWWDSRTAQMVTLETSESHLAATVGRLGKVAKHDLWPDSTIEDAGFNLLLVHLDEVLATRDVSQQPLRITKKGLNRPPAPERTRPPEGEWVPYVGPG